MGESTKSHQIGKEGNDDGADKLACYCFVRDGIYERSERSAIINRIARATADDADKMRLCYSTGAN